MTVLTKRHIYSHGLGAGSPFAQTSEFKADDETPSQRGQEGILGQCPPVTPHRHSLIYKEARDGTGRWAEDSGVGREPGRMGKVCL